MKRGAKKEPQFHKLNSLDALAPADPPLNNESKPSRWTARRNREAQVAAERCKCHGRGLPVQHKGTTKVTLEERYHYEAHRRRHLEAFPDYDAGWRRPSTETVNAIYDLVKGFVPPLDQIHPDTVTAMQLVTVALDVAVISGRYGHRVERHTDDAEERLRQVRRAVTRNTLTDAVMRRWSDHARLAREEKRAFSITQMTQATARNSWRDLLVQNIQLPVLWNLVKKDNPLYRVRASRFDVSREAGAGAVTGYEISLRPGEKLKAFERLVRRDRLYCPSRVSHTWRLWVVGRKKPMVDIAAPIAAERPYNQVEIGDKTREVLRLQENARLMFDTRMFVRDYRNIRQQWRQVRRELSERFPTKTWPPSPEEQKLRTAEVKLQAFLSEHRSVYEQAVPLQQQRYPGTVPPAGVVPIRSAFYKVLNRRYQNAHFWLAQISGRPDFIGRDYDDLLRVWFGSPRARWFSVPWHPAQNPCPDNSFALPWQLVSMDISASQTQIQAILLGDDAMEQDAVLSRRPHKVVLAERAWRAHEGEDWTLLIDYQGPTDRRLAEMMKNLWMVLGYGSDINSILRKQARNPDLYGKGWRRVPSREALRLGGNHTTPDYNSITRVMREIPGFLTRQVFLDSCREAVERHLANPYASIKMVDPLDGAEFEWNQPLAEAAPLRLNEWDLSLVKLGFYVKSRRCPRCGTTSPAPRRLGTRWYCRETHRSDAGREYCGHVWPATFRELEPDPDGRLLLDAGKLRKMLAPCLIHMLDSLFASYVMLALAADGVTEFVSVHDCWFCPAFVHREGREPEPGHAVLDRAIRVAGRPWFLALEPIYKWMREYIGGEQIERAYEKWLARRARGLAGDETAWPYFYAVPSDLGEGADSPGHGTELPSSPTLP